MGRSYGRSASSPISTTRPSKPSARSVSAALAPARLAPTIMNVWSVAMWHFLLLSSGSDSGHALHRGCMNMQVRAWREDCRACQREELLARTCVLAQHAMHGRGNRLRSPGLDPPHGHAHVLGLDHDTDSLGGEVLLKPVRHLDRQTFLHLKVAGEQLDNAGQLRQAEDAFARQVADVGDSGERQHVVLAQ